ncbi:MAG: hypothetical protein HY584_04105 [Candidatus Omnitrophica bacterium]|nr:hypothetical protein [Candidatus Omnitrophota bacterium]
MTQSQDQDQKIKERSILSFKKYELKNDQLELNFIPKYGCSWSTLRVCLEGKWVDLLKPLFGDRVPFHYGSFIMAPWSNRIGQGTFGFEGKRYALRKNFPDGTAIHGDVRTRPWEVKRAADKEFEATLDSREVPDFNYPFKLKFKHTLELTGNRLTMALFIENVDERRAPVGFGFHPFFRRRLTDRDQDVALVLPAEKVYPDEKYIPRGTAIQVAGKTDLRSERFLGDADLDHCFTDLRTHLIRLIYSGSKREVHVRVDPVLSHTVIYAPSGTDGRAADFVAVEPVTHVTNGFNFRELGWNHTGVKVLEPGEQWGGGCDISIKNLNQK